MRKRHTIQSEWELAIWTALWFWPGTSITDGAFAILKQVAALQSHQNRRSHERDHHR